MANTIKILVYDSAEGANDGIYEKLNAFSDIEIVEKTSFFGKCIHFSETLSPDVILADSSLTAEEAAVLKSYFPKKKIVVFFSDSGCIGADAYCGKELTPEDIHTVLRLTAADKIDFDTNSANKLIFKLQNANNRREQLLNLYRELFKLSKGELELLRALCRGETYESIARERFVAPDSVRRMSNRLVKRLGEKNLKSLLNRLHILGAFEFSDSKTER